MSEQKVTLVCIWASGEVTRETDTIQKIAERMADLSERPAPPEMQIHTPRAERPHAR